MFGSVLGRAVEVGEAGVAVGAGVVVVGEEPAVLEGDALGFVSPPHPANNIDAASGTASRAAEVFLLVEASFAVEIDFTVVNFTVVNFTVVKFTVVNIIVVSNFTVSPTAMRAERGRHDARRFFG